jgi:hypothetical protein
MLFTQIAGSYPRPTIDEGIRIQVAQKITTRLLNRYFLVST